jgi:hypothetical protein
MLSESDIRLFFSVGLGKCNLIGSAAAAVKILFLKRNFVCNHVGNNVNKLSLNRSGCGRISVNKSIQLI